MNVRDGIDFGSVTSASVSVEGCQVWGNGRDGIRGYWETPIGPLVVQDTRVRGNGGHGIFLSGNPFGGSGMTQLTISGSSVNENAENGIQTSGTASVLVITDSEVSRNGDDGIAFHQAGAGPLLVNVVSVGDCRVEQNGGVGLRVTSAGGIAKWSAWGSTFARNGGAAIDDNGLPAANASCQPGYNLFAMNAGAGGPANFVGAGANTCTALGNANQTQ
jgi:hypothetical protein